MARGFYVRIYNNTVYFIGSIDAIEHSKQNGEDFFRSLTKSTKTDPKLNKPDFANFQKEHWGCKNDITIFNKSICEPIDENLNSPQGDWIKEQASFLANR